MYSVLRGRPRRWAAFQCEPGMSKLTLTKRDVTCQCVMLRSSRENRCSLCCALQLLLLFMAYSLQNALLVDDQIKADQMGRT
jgi:hypothetical protein